MHHFRAFNLAIFSEIHFPSWTNIHASIADVEIKYGDVAHEGIAAPSKTGPFFQANQQALWLNIPNIARFLVRDGREIIIDKSDGAGEASIRVFILTSCFRALLIQRGMVVLYGNAIKIGSGAVAVVAPSGFGKSTLCKLFMNKGYSILSDDICAINAQLEVLPSYPEISLWGSIVTQLKLTTTGLRPIRPGIEKFALPLGEQFYQTPLPLKCIYMLDFHKKDNLSINLIPPHSRSTRFKTGQFHSAFLHNKDFGDVSQQLTKEVELLELYCPRWEQTMSELGYLFARLVDTIEQDMLHRGIANDAG